MTRVGGRLGGGPVLGFVDFGELVESNLVRSVGCSGPGATPAQLRLQLAVLREHRHADPCVAGGDLADSAPFLASGPVPLRCLVLELRRDLAVPGRHLQRVTQDASHHDAFDPEGVIAEVDPVHKHRVLPVDVDEFHRAFIDPPEHPALEESTDTSDYNVEIPRNFLGAHGHYLTVSTACDVHAIGPQFEAEIRSWLEAVRERSRDPVHGILHGVERRLSPDMPHPRTAVAPARYL